MTKKLPSEHDQPNIYPAAIKENLHEYLADASKVKANCSGTRLQTNRLKEYVCQCEYSVFVVGCIKLG